MMGRGYHSGQMIWSSLLYVPLYTTQQNPVIAFVAIKMKLEGHFHLFNVIVTPEKLIVELVPTYL